MAASAGRPTSSPPSSATWGSPRRARPATTLYPDGDLDCRGQIRFGEAGAAAAATLAIVVPCTELVRDARGDDSVDLAVGTAFSDVKPSSTARDVLDQLANPSVGDGSGNADESGAGTPPGPAVDPALLQKARDTPC
ncbi:hypothetical protein ACFQV8_20295 [Pseudonocardia benzenivorans]